MARPLLAVPIVAALLLAGWPAGAAADPGPTLGCEPGHVPVLGRACQRPDGLYAVQLDDGLVLHTHGPDPRPSAQEDTGFAAGEPERPLLCATQSRLAVLYGHPEGTPDRLASVAADLRAALRRMNHVLAEDAVASGGPVADYKVACDATGEILVASFTGPAAGSAAYTAEYDGIVQAARKAGHVAKETDYLIFWDAESTVCGVGNLYGDTRLAADNDNMVETGYGVVYDGCWFGRTPMHENGHNQGAVQDLAPNWDGSGHCIEGLDVMCYPGQQGVTGTATLGLVYQCRDRVHYDCNWDTYFDAAPEAGEWLDRNWNIGDPVNRYLAFGGNLSEPPAASGTASPAAQPSKAPASASKSASPSATRAPAGSPSGSGSASRTVSAVIVPNAATGGAAQDDAGLAQQPAQANGLPLAAAAAALAALAVAVRRRLERPPGP